MPVKYVDDPLSIPFFERPEAVQTMADIWKRNRYGAGDTESSFVVHGHRPDGTPILLPVADEHARDKEHFKVGPGDTDIVHTHPNAMDPKPSYIDQDVAKDHNLGMYVMSKDGLYQYQKGMKNPELVQTGSDTANWNITQPAMRRPDIENLPARSLGSATVPLQEPTMEQQQASATPLGEVKLRRQ